MSTQTRPPAWAVFTDGSCWAKDRVGGWAWVAFTKDMAEPISGSGAMENTTISRMELEAPIQALETLRLMQREPCDVWVLSDSEYVVKGVNDPGRARNKHLDLWERLEAAISRNGLVLFEHVKGHHESFYNDQADNLAGAARKTKQRENSSLTS